MTKFDLTPIDLVSPTIEAVVLSGASSIVAQAVHAYSRKDFLSFDLAQTLQFIVFSAITTPPNYAFQYMLESTFPTTCPAESTQRSAATPQKVDARQAFSIKNTLMKFVLDQSIAASANTALYICLMGSIKGYSSQYIQTDLQENFWSLLFASYRFWPFVCLLNFVAVPVRLRPLVGSMAGLIWGVFLSLRQAS